ncbi:hypothetical protein Celaphus_00009823, partial [Cervus elaphus hippelaphus]
MLFLVTVVVTDSYYYRKLVTAPLNIVLYNVFTLHGPDLYDSYLLPALWHCSEGILGPLICIQNFTELPQTQPSTVSQKANSSVHSIRVQRPVTKTFCRGNTGLHIVPTDMNDQNLEEPSRHTDIMHANYTILKPQKAKQTKETMPMAPKDNHPVNWGFHRQDSLQ